MDKRVFDWIVSSMGLLLLSPLFVVICILIKLDSNGPVFFRQVRVGRGGALFRIHKFRTMVIGAEKNGLQITVGADARITRIGQWLRKYKVDELPQLIDVWVGDMSLVGPRPEVPRYVNIYPDEIRKFVLSVRPGITDKASLEFKNENAILAKAVDPNQTYIQEIIPIKLKYYVEYVQTHSMSSDIALILKTLKEVVH